MWLLLVNVCLSLSTDASLTVNDPQGFLREISFSQNVRQGCYNSLFDVRTRIQCSSDCLSARNIKYYELITDAGNKRRCVCKSSMDSLRLQSPNVTVELITPRRGNPVVEYIIHRRHNYDNEGG